MTRVRVTVRGTVQGVGYRYSLRRVADREGVSGWVRNRADGSVAAELEGETAAVEAVLAWAAADPPPPPPPELG
ncbi:MAG: acylphosphatase [Microbacterium sp.]|uniref:acylphosphatase n=1 Tax=Microbacterium sp. TaxID=51671 RepID=UPI00262C7D6B|nr:acylphosphatase [Microbacterium sp.]MCX6502808.1 acylphosphatase [Microbacterium sp.]